MTELLTAPARTGATRPEEVIRAAEDLLHRGPPGMRQVINATGVLLHGNLGRAVLSGPARRAIVDVSGGVDLEYDLARGRRGPRGASALAALAAAVPAAGAVHVVNNNAAALVLAATALAAGRDLVISRRELVEAGDGIRLPDLLASTGARIVEVGDTADATLADYAGAVWSGTGLILRIHGGTSPPRVDPAALAALGVPVVVDIGTGLLAPEPALPGLPDADTALRAGASLVTGSGDKLLGGPQSGLLLGRRRVVEQLRRHPLARALRVDKLTLAGLEATLRHPPSPVVEALRHTVADLDARAARILRLLTAAGVDATGEEAEATVGGGAAAGVRLPSRAIGLPRRLAGPLRRHQPAVVGRVRGGRLLLDLRSVPGDLDGALISAVLDAARSAPAAGAGGN